MPCLHLIIASTRPGRVGLPVGLWAHERAVAHGSFEVELVDLAEVDLPFLDEPNHPRLRQYTRQHTKDWSARVERADAFVIVTPEYNYAMSAPLKNALDFLHQEWKHKPVGFVSYGGVSAGTRAVQMIKQVTTALQMVPVSTAVSIPFVREFIDDRGQVKANGAMRQAADGMLDELVRFEQALRPLRLSDLTPAS